MKYRHYLSPAQKARHAAIQKQADMFLAGKVGGAQSHKPAAASTHHNLYSDGPIVIRGPLYFDDGIAHTCMPWDECNCIKI